MATPSPVSSSQVGESAITSTVMNGSGPPQRLISLDTPPTTNKRGLNKPKCIKCGNVARSRCPYQSCKNCCAKAQNPCHIHVLKQTSILPAQPPPSTAPLPEQPSSDTPSNGASWRLSSLRKISTAFASTSRVKKPLTRKDAVNINKWRFAKLKEHIEAEIEAENEAFDRYIWNVGLLEETFSTEGLGSDGRIQLTPTSSEEKYQQLVSSIKVKLQSNTEKADGYRDRIRDLVGQLLGKLRGRDLVSDEVSPDADELDAYKQPKRSKKGFEWRAERTTAFSDIIDKLSKVRTEDDLKSCLEMKSQLLDQSESKGNPSGEPNQEKLLVPNEPDSIQDLSVYCLPNMCTTVGVDQEAYANINKELSSIGQLAEL